MQEGKVVYICMSFSYLTCIACTAQGNPCGHIGKQNVLGKC